MNEFREIVYSFREILKLFSGKGTDFLYLFSARNSAKVYLEICNKTVNMLALNYQEAIKIKYIEIKQG